MADARGRTPIMQYRQLDKGIFETGETLRECWVHAHRRHAYLGALVNHQIVTVTRELLIARLEVAFDGVERIWITAQCVVVGPQLILGKARKVDLTLSGGLLTLRSRKTGIRSLGWA